MSPRLGKIDDIPVRTTDRTLTCHQRVHPLTETAITGYALSPVGGLDNQPRGTEGADSLQITSSLKMYCDTDAITLQGYHIHSHSNRSIRYANVKVAISTAESIQYRVNSNFKAVTINLFRRAVLPSLPSLSFLSFSIASSAFLSLSPRRREMALQIIQLL